MQVVQRMLLLLLIIVGLFFGMMMLKLEREEEIKKQWETSQVERFIGNICRRGNCTYEEYLLCHRALNYVGNTSEIAIEAYQKQKDMSGGHYYYMISWEEIREELYQEGEFVFPKESVVVVEVSRKSKYKAEESKYYDIVSGRD